MIDPIDENLEFGNTVDFNDLIFKFKAKAKRIRDGSNFDISKCFSDGKDLLLTGDYIDPEQYLCLNNNFE